MSEVENGHPDITATIQDKRIPALRLKVIDAMDENVLVEDVKVRSVIDANGVIEESLDAIRTRRVSKHPAAETRQSPANGISFGCGDSSKDTVINGCR